MQGIAGIMRLVNHEYLAFEDSVVNYISKCETKSFSLTEALPKWIPFPGAIDNLPSRQDSLSDIWDSAIAPT